MMDTVWFIFNAFFSELFVHIYMVVFSSQFLGKPKRIVMILFIAATFIYLPVFFIYSYYFHGDLMAFAREDRNLSTVIDITLIALYYYFGYRPQKLKKIVMCAAVNYSCFMMSDLLCSVIFYFTEILTGFDFGIFTMLVRTSPYYSFIFVPVGGLMYLFMFLIKKLYHKKLKFTGIMTFAIFPITQFVILHTFVMIIQRTYVPKQSGYILSLFMLIIVLSIVSNIVLLRIMKKSKEKEVLEQKIHFFEHYEVLSQQYQEQIESTSHEFSKLRHDFNNHMQVMTRLIQEDYIDDASQLAEELRKKYSSEKYRLKFCENNIINIILQHTQRICEKNDIALTVSCDVPAEIGIQKVDFCSLMTNLMSNASRACIEMTGSDKKIDCSVWQTEEMLFIKVRNSKENAIIKSDGRLKTTQYNKLLHGFGMEIIEHIAKIYDGTVSIEYDEHSFTTIVQLNLLMDTV